MNLTKSEAQQQIEKLQKHIAALDLVEQQTENDNWVSIGYDQIPRETFEKYGAKPFEIMRRKMRKDGDVWSDINYFDAKKAIENLGYRLPTIQEVLVLLDAYVAEHGTNTNRSHQSFLGIEELSYDERVYLEWIDGPRAFVRGGSWVYPSDAGVFALNLSHSPTGANGYIGFRCAR